MEVGQPQGGIAIMTRRSGMAARLSRTTDMAKTGLTKRIAGPVGVSTRESLGTKNPIAHRIRLAKGKRDQ